VIGGPNGSGKSSISKDVNFRGKENLLDPDAIAKRINPLDPLKAGIEAGREALRRSRQHIVAGNDFAIETTLSGGWILREIQSALDRGFLVHLVYVCVENPNINIRRVAERFEQGGHFVPDDDVRRRYERSLVNLRALIPIVDQVLIYDNSGPGLKLILEFRSGAICFESVGGITWARPLLEANRA
jgi:predicted ABC-type ATPase